MPRYIDADKRLAELKKEKEELKEIGWRDFASMKYALEYAPTADVVEVVRCKDCKWLDEYHCCTKITAFISGNLTFFCALGERRTDENI